MPTALSSFELAMTVEDLGHRKRLRYLDAGAAMYYVNQLAVGASIIGTFREESAHRSKSLPQVKYWKGCVCPFVADHCGTSEKQAELALLGAKFGYIEGPGGHEIPMVTTIKDFSVEEMTELISWALDWVPAELEIVLPHPDKEWKEHEAEIRRQLRRSA